jgi:hypothetical protein
MGLFGTKYVTNVNVGPQKKRGGCGKLLLFIVIAIVILAVIGSM